MLPQAQEVRNYHSVALLMPNGAVWVAGSNFNSATGLGNRNLWIEIFEPWYFCHPRPQITAVDPSVCAGSSFDVYTSNTSKIDQVVMVRAGSCTHNFNPDQRLVECEFEVKSATRLSVQAPPNNAVAPPGRYLVFVLTDKRVPSEGKFIKLCQGTATAPRPAWPPWLDDWILEVLRWRLRPTPWPPPDWEPPEPWPRPRPGPSPRSEDHDLFVKWMAALKERGRDLLDPPRELGSRLEDSLWERTTEHDSGPSKDDHPHNH